MVLKKLMLQPSRHGELALPNEVVAKVAVTEGLVWWMFPMNKFSTRRRLFGTFGRSLQCPSFSTVRGNVIV